MAAPVLINAPPISSKIVQEVASALATLHPRMTEGADARFGAHPYWVAHGEFVMGFEKQRSNTP